jgi:hypothetical protein
VCDSKTVHKMHPTAGSGWLQILTQRRKCQQAVSCRHNRLINVEHRVGIKCAAAKRCIECTLRLATHPIRAFVDGCPSHHSPPLPFVHSWPHSWTVAPLPTRHPPHSCIRGRLPHSPLATHPIRVFVVPFVDGCPTHPNPAFVALFVDGCPTRHTPPTPFVYSWPHSWTVAPLATHPIRVFVAPFVDGCPSHQSPPTPFVHSWPHLWTVAPVTTRHPPHSCIRGPICGRLPQSPITTPRV